MSSYDYIYKVLLLGDGTVGKTSLVVRFVHNKFKEPYVMTIGMEPYSRYDKIDGTKICYSIWDIAGQKRFAASRTMFYRSVQASLVVFDLTQRTSFENTENWIAEAKNESPNQIFVLVGNKNDLVDLRVVSYEEASQKAKELGALEYVETSALTGENVIEVFTKIGSKLLKKGIEN